MIKKIKLINFRNFEEKIIEFIPWKNFIIWENGKWKTNILESISILWNNSLLGLQYENLTKKNTNFFYVEYENTLSEKISISFDKENNKKKFLMNSKSLTKPKFKENTYKCVIFSPIIMNMMYLSPSLRRDFLDNILISSFPNYEKLLRDYKKVVQSRNRILKNISEWKSSRDEIKFWDDNFIDKAVKIYNFRFQIVNFISYKIQKSTLYFWDKVDEIKFVYKNKITDNHFNINNDDIKKIIKEYLEKNFERDIILRKTNIWPHIDDFDILVDNIPLVNFASRWETKSIIIELKILEIAFIEKNINKKPILIIDDLLSELDDDHKNTLLERINDYQTFITSINKSPKTKLEDKITYL